MIVYLTYNQMMRDTKPLEPFSRFRFATDMLEYHLWNGRMTSDRKCKMKYKEFMKLVLEDTKPIQVSIDFKQRIN